MSLPYQTRRGVRAKWKWGLLCQGCGAQRNILFKCSLCGMLTCGRCWLSSDACDQTCRMLLLDEMTRSRAERAGEAKLKRGSRGGDAATQERGEG